MVIVNIQFENVDPTDLSTILRAIKQALPDYPFTANTMHLEQTRSELIDLVVRE